MCDSIPPFKLQSLAQVDQCEKFEFPPQTIRRLNVVKFMHNEVLIGENKIDWFLSKYSKIAWNLSCYKKNI